MTQNRTSLFCYEILSYPFFGNATSNWCAMERSCFTPGTDRNFNSHDACIVTPPDDTGAVNSYSCSKSTNLGAVAKGMRECTAERTRHDGEPYHQQVSYCKNCLSSLVRDFFDGQFPRERATHARLMRRPSRAKPRTDPLFFTMGSGDQPAVREKKPEENCGASLGETFGAEHM